MKGLLRLYPKRWRERYGDEFETVLEEDSNCPGARSTMPVARS